MTKASEAKAAAKGGVQDINAGATVSTPIKSAGALTVVRVKAVRSTDALNGVTLPEDASVGDVVEIYVEGYSGRVYAPDGQLVASLGTSSGALFRKIDDASWRFIGH